MSFKFRIYVTGESRRSLQALNNLRSMCDTRIPNHYELDIIDVLDQPEAAEEARIMATPTVIRIAPMPHRRVVGDLSDLAAAAIALELPEPPVQGATG